MTTVQPPQLQMTAHALLLDSSGRVLLVRAASGVWALPSTVLTFQVSPYRQVVVLARDVLGIEVAEHDLLLAHVCAHRSATARAGLGLVISVGHWDGEPVPSPASAGGQPGRRWCAPGDPPRPVAAWDAAVLPALLVNRAYAEIGWHPRQVATPTGASR
ncbi:hypothetical protein [Frankia gtarii]|uniref:hypothetical protein n=1 Tax=Frankia gtarii TaxID=2950102 RepID=UPI0021BF1900|nr:hypothetical protein [Frankia gtarii]